MKILKTKFSKRDISYSHVSRSRFGLSLSRFGTGDPSMGGSRWIRRIRPVFRSLVLKRARNPHETSGHGVPTSVSYVYRVMSWFPFRLVYLQTHTVTHYNGIRTYPTGPFV